MSEENKPKRSKPAFSGSHRWRPQIVDLNDTSGKNSMRVIRDRDMRRKVLDRVANNPVVDTKNPVSQIKDRSFKNERIIEKRRTVQD